MTDESTGYDDVLSRRRFVELAGVTGAAALAGCDGDSGTNGTPTGEGPGNFPNQRHVGVTATDPSEVQFNPTNTTSQPEISQYLLFEQFGKYNYNDGAFQGSAIEEWNFTQGESLELTLRDDLTWSNGDPVTAQDIVTQLELARKDGDSMFDWAGEVSSSGDYTVTISIASEVNPSLVEVDVLQRFVQQADSVYGEYVDQDVSEIRGFADTDPVTNGPFQYEERSSGALLTSSFDDSPYADNINFGEYSFEFISSNSQRQQSLLSLDVDSDYSLTVPSDVVADFPDAVEEVRIPDVFGLGLAPDFTDKYAGDKAVRQAVQYVINRTQAVENSLPRVKTAPEYPTGIPSDYQSTWLEGVEGEFDSYGYESSKTEEATTVLEAAGYSKQGGTWEDASGNTVPIEITHPTGWSDWTLGLESAVSDLNNFGFDASLSGTGNYFNNITNRESFQFIANTWLHGGPSPYPYFALLHQLHEPQLHNTHTAYPGYTEQYGGSNATISLDSATPNAGETEVDVGAKLDELASTTSESDQTTLIQDLAYVANQDLPRIAIKEKQLQQWVTSDTWTVPEDVGSDPDANVTWAPTWLPRQGKMNYEQN